MTWGLAYLCVSTLVWAVGAHEAWKVRGQDTEALKTAGIYLIAGTAWPVIVVVPAIRAIGKAVESQFPGGDR